MMKLRVNAGRYCLVDDDVEVEEAAAAVEAEQEDEWEAFGFWVLNSTSESYRPLAFLATFLLSLVHLALRSTTASNQSLNRGISATFALMQL